MDSKYAAFQGSNRCFQKKMRSEKLSKNRVQEKHLKCKHHCHKPSQNPTIVICIYMNLSIIYDQDYKTLDLDVFYGCRKGGIMLII